ncbi:class I tRNA ligase family protein [Candidatus Nitrososphaera gargensis]|uniref:class I tRNA ligase family protein n=1 Tax=Candidatus Nitrososphaera gargensis TaxID=497727 RepID=UPI0011E53A78|nr:class I tRNA ligase family protein [Candidatus Nitrososphaera gargensis]
MKTRLITSFFATGSNVQQLYDTLSGRKERFVVKGNQVRMLLCGPTVYDYAHIGHARMLLFYDLMARYFRSKKIGVSVIVNITDIDQKVFSKARAAATGPAELASKFIDELLRDLSSLGIDGFMLARVSDHVTTARQLVAGLLQSGKAYSAGGNVYLDTAATLSLGMMAKMTKKDLDDCRLDISPAKKSPSDILMWNASESFDVSFRDDILGSGIPWWHMQDASVAMANYGGLYDIHGGASELVYPHHESHLAQLQALTLRDRPVRFWTHVGLVRTKGKKMSKSLGNTVAVRDLLKRYSANALRLYFYSRHYRDDFDFSESDLGRFQRIDDMIASAMNSRRLDGRKMAERFFDRIEDDFDTPGAISVLIEGAKSRSADLGTMVSVFGLRY